MRIPYGISHFGQIREQDCLYVDKTATPERNRYLTLRLEFTGINTDGTAQDVQRSVCQAMRPAVHHFCSRYSELVPELAALDRELDFTDYPASLMSRLLGVLQAAGQQLYLFADEYDNATSLLISSDRHALYAQVTQDGGFLRELYKTFKAGPATGVIRRPGAGPGQHPAAGGGGARHGLRR